MIWLGLYQLLFPLVALAALAGVAKARRWGAFREGLADLKERLGLPPVPEDGRPTLWVHAASVGEVLALRQPLERWAGAWRVVVTTATAAGREKARALPGVSAAFLAPADFAPCVCAFLRRTTPRALVCAESELWPMMLTSARRHGVKVGLINACLSERSASRWAKVRSLPALALRGVTRVAYQTEDDRRRFEALGAPAEAGAVTGNTKYDLRPPSAEKVAEAQARIRAMFKGAPVWVAGSTRPGEEELVLAAHAAAAKRLPSLRLVLAPRHPERAAEVAELLKKAQLPAVRWSELLPFANDPAVLLVDVLGVLAPLYACGRAAFVGGTLVPGSGGHNVLEPAAMGMPVLFGPHVDAVRYEAAALASWGGCVRVSPEGLAEGLLSLLEDPARAEEMGRKAKQAAETFSGAASRAMDWLAPVLKAPGHSVRT